MSTIVMAYSNVYGGYAAGSTLTVGTDVTQAKAQQLVGDGLAAYGAGGTATPAYSSLPTSVALVGAPSSGTWLAGASVIDANGVQWHTVAGGSPPSDWTQVNQQGVELGYAESTAQFATTSATPVAVPGVAVTVTTGSRPIMVKAWDQTTFNGTDGAGETFSINEDGTAVSQLFVTGKVNCFTPWQIQRRRAPSAGSHTYALYMDVTASTTGTVCDFSLDRTCIQVIQL